MWQVEDVGVVSTKSLVLQSLNEHNELRRLDLNAPGAGLTAKLQASSTSSSPLSSMTKAAALLHAEVMQQWSLDMPEVQLALSTLTTFEAMLSPMGAIYYAPQGTYNATRGSISTENCASTYAGLRMFQQVPCNSVNHNLCSLKLLIVFCVLCEVGIAVDQHS